MGCALGLGEPRPDELDPTVLMWWIRGGIDPAVFGERRVVLHVLVPDARRRRFWFVIRPDDVSLCFTDPGYDIDVTLQTPLGVLYQMWEGVFELPAAARDGLLQVAGRRELVLRLPDALRLSPVAPYVRRARARPGVTAAPG